MIRFLAANLPFFGWHFLFSRGVSKIASEFDVLFGHECVLKKTQITHLKASLRSHKDTFGGNSGPLGSATPNTVGSQLCCVSHPHLETKSRTEITKHINRSGQPQNTQFGYTQLYRLVTTANVFFFVPQLPFNYHLLYDFPHFLPAVQKYLAF